MPIQTRPTTGDTSWFVHDRFGLFIHWGLYALPARHEWVQTHELIAPDRYQRYFDHFNPDLYDPRAWARAAREAGMRYVVLTAKHHEGFCLWDTQYTEYKVTNTPFGQDVLAPFVEAFRAEGLRVGFYYSLLDWHHPHYPIDMLHPLRDHPDALAMNETRDMTQYAAYLHNQVRELLTLYPDLAILWMDFSYPHRRTEHYVGKGRADWQSEKLVAMIRELAPHIILNNRLDLPAAADITTPEQYQPRAWPQIDGEYVVWEACQTLSGSWGYHRDETSWKSPEQLIRMLISTVATGGNLLMNVGPTGRGLFDDRALNALGVYRDWMRLHSRSITGCTQSEFAAPPDVRFTQNGDRLYVHLFAWPFKRLELPGLAGRVAYAQLLNDASEIPLREPSPSTDPNIDTAIPDGTLLLELPVIKPDVVVPVIELFLK